MSERDRLIALAKEHGAQVHAPYVSIRQDALEAFAAALSHPHASEQGAAPLTDSYVQNVPDKCDRIVWRNNYYHLPLKAAPHAPAPVPPVSAGLIDDELASWSAASHETRQAVRIFADGLRKRIAQQAAEPDMRAVCEALGFDPTNHHNAAKCPYCRHAAPVQAAPTEPDILAGLRRIAKHADDDGTAAIHIEFLDRVIDEIEDMGKAYALLFAENAKLRAAVDAATPAPVAAPAPVPPLQGADLGSNYVYEAYPEWQVKIAHQELDRLGVVRAEGEDLLSVWGRVSRLLAAPLHAVGGQAIIDAALAWYESSDKGEPAHNLAMAILRYKQAASGEQPAAPTVEQAITALVSALADSKGWMRDYADAIVRDAIDRRGGEGEKAKRRCILGCEFLRGENICRSCGNAYPSVQEAKEGDV